MGKKKVYLVQPSEMKQNKSTFLPYSAGCLVAYAFNFEEIRNDFEFGGFVYIKETVEKSMEIIRDPVFVGFSCYMWNVEYNLALAKAVKEKYPEAVISFGGPQIPDDTEYLEKYDFIDVLTNGEGEVVFYELLSCIAKGETFHSVKNISFRCSGKIIHNEKRIPCDITDFPSPYTSGCFDYIVNDPALSDIQFDTVMETNRGCPYGCVYCCWGRNGAKVRPFSMEKVKSELLWLAEHKIAFCFCGDGNFGILKRDEEIADYVIELKKKYGYPERFETYTDKNKKDFAFRINLKLERAGLNRGISIAVQSLTPEVLKIIGRRNVSQEDLYKELKKYRENDIFTYTDIILGLPGETLDSFCRSLFGVIEAGQHYAINIHCCELLPNTVLRSPEMIEKYKIKTIISKLCQYHTEITDAEAMGSRSEMVVETSTMSSSDWKEAFKVATLAQSFHCMGLLRLISVYLRKARNISYYDFYMSIYGKSEKEKNVIYKLINETCGCIDDFIAGKGNFGYTNPDFGNVYYPFQDALFLNCVNNLDELYLTVSDLLSEYRDETLDDVIRYQKEMITLQSQPPKSIRFKYDWPDYFKDIFDESYTQPVKREVIVHFDKSRYDNFADYSKEIVWFGKRRDLTINKDFSVEYT